MKRHRRDRLVIFFVPDPVKGVAEMARVVRPGGTVAAYAWDVMGGGFPHESIQAEMRAMGLKTVHPPNVEASRIEVLHSLWSNTNCFLRMEVTWRRLCGMLPNAPQAGRAQRRAGPQTDRCPEPPQVRIAQ